MTDVHSSEIRSYNMSRIRSKDTKPELIVRKYLFSHGFRYRLYDKNLPGKPDLVLKRYKTVIFVHGCFWHGHKNCKYAVIPKTKTEWWYNKIEYNKKKDIINYQKLNDLGWKVFILYECELKTSKKEETLTKLINELY